MNKQAWDEMAELETQAKLYAKKRRKGISASTQKSVSTLSAAKIVLGYSTPASRSFPLTIHNSKLFYSMLKTSPYFLFKIGDISPREEQSNKQKAYAI